MTSYDPNGLKSPDYEHPSDRAALAALKSIPLLDKVMGVFLDLSIKSGMYIKDKGDGMRVTRETYPRLYDLYETAVQRLNMKVEPKLYLSFQYEYNAYATGVNEPYIVAHSSCIRDSTDEEILYLLGHELGHINSGHVLYHNLANVLGQNLTGVFQGLAPLVSTGLMFSLYDWQRKSELTADRAGAIAAGGVDGGIGFSIRTMGKGSCDRYIDFSLENILEQYQEFDLSREGVLGKLIYMMETAYSTHPWTIARIKALTDWKETEQYRELMAKIA